MKYALTSVRKGTGMPVAFLGRVDGRTLRLTEFDGVVTRGLTGLEVARGTGLGGRVVMTRQAGTVADYEGARGISHHYDAPVLAEGLRSMIAVPVSLRGEPVAVLYAAARSRNAIGERPLAAVAAVSRRLSEEFAVQREVERRLSMIESAAVGDRRRSALTGAEIEDVRAVHAELRAIVEMVEDPEVAERLLGACARLAGDRPGPEGGQPHLTSREVDVLAYVALGCTNTETGDRLGLGRETVKSYLWHAMRKLDVATRHAAVVRARELGILP